MSYGAATQVNVTSLCFSKLDKRTSKQTNWRVRASDVRFSYNFSYYLLYIVCVNIQVRNASWDAPINTTPSFTTYRLDRRLLRSIITNKQIHIQDAIFSFSVFGLLLFVSFRNTYQHIGIFIWWCRSFIQVIYHM